MKLSIIGAGNVARPLRNARLLEAHAMLWIELSLKRGLGCDWAFARVKR